MRHHEQNTINQWKPENKQSALRIFFFLYRDFEDPLPYSVCARIYTKKKEDMYVLKSKIKSKTT